MNVVRNKRLIILALEGVDKSGKGTLLKELNQQSNYDYLCIDRFTASASVYDELYKRRNRKRLIQALESELLALKSALVFNVYLTATGDALLKRIKAGDEYPDERINELQKAIKLFEMYMNNVTRLPTLIIDTTNMTPKQSAKLIIKRIKKYVEDNC